MRSAFVASALRAAAASSAASWRRNAVNACATVRPPCSRRQRVLSSSSPAPTNGFVLVQQRDQRDRSRLRVCRELHAEHRRDPVVPAAVRCLPLLEQANDLAAHCLRSAEMSRGDEHPSRRLHERPRIGRPTPAPPLVRRPGKRNTSVRQCEVECARRTGTIQHEGGERRGRRAVDAAVHLGEAAVCTLTSFQPASLHVGLQEQEQREPSARPPTVLPSLSESRRSPADAREARCEDAYGGTTGSQAE